MTKTISTLLTMMILVTMLVVLSNTSNVSGGSYDYSLNWSGYVLYENGAADPSIREVASSIKIKPISKFDDENHGGFAVWASVMPRSDGSIEIFQGGYYAMYTVDMSGEVVKQYAIFVMHYLSRSSDMLYQIEPVEVNETADIVIVR